MTDAEIDSLKPGSVILTPGGTSRTVLKVSRGKVSCCDVIGKFA